MDTTRLGTGAYAALDRGFTATYVPVDNSVEQTKRRLLEEGAFGVEVAASSREVTA